VPRILIAPDKFKGSASAAQVAAHLMAGLRDSRPGLDIDTVPIADGGEGTVDAALNSGFRPRTVTAAGPLGRPVECTFAVADRVAVIEMAAASGLHSDGDRDVMLASSRGTGELIRSALDTGCTTIILGVGGSACTDGGSGLLSALGAVLRDRSGNAVEDGGAPLVSLGSVDLDGLDRRLADVDFVLASDVDGPLLGPTGAAHLYSAQKGATTNQAAELEEALTRWAQLIQPDTAQLPGAGAGGGVGFAALSVLHAAYRPGIDVLLDLLDIHDRLAATILTITGEGTIDEQTLQGKAPAGVAAASRAAGVPVVAVCGRCTLSRAQHAKAGFDRIYQMIDVEPDVATCITKPGLPLLRIGQQIADNHL
jgi:glycerate kinase